MYFQYIFMYLVEAASSSTTEQQLSKYKVAQGNRLLISRKLSLASKASHMRTAAGTEVAAADD